MDYELNSSIEDLPAEINYDSDFEEEYKSEHQNSIMITNVSSSKKMMGNSEPYEKITLKTVSSSGTSLQNPQKALNRLQIENGELRNQLKSLNIRLNEVLDLSKNKVYKAPDTSTREEGIRKQAETKDKQTKLYEIEYQRLKSRLEQLQDGKYILGLKNTIKEKENAIKDYERNLKPTYAEQKKTAKALHKMYGEGISEDVKEINDLMEESNRIREQVNSLEAKMERDHEAYEH